MRHQRRRGIEQQIRALQAIISLQEQVKKLFAQGSQETVCKNKDLTRFLRRNVREGMHELNLAIKYDRVTISRACREKKRLRVALAEYTVEEARALLSSHVFDRMNAHNVLLFEVKRRGKLLEDLRLRLQQLVGLDTASPESKLQLQMIRQLENSIEKMRVKITTAEKTCMLYTKMLDVLREELSHFPFILDDLESRVGVYQVELKGMHLMAVDAIEAMEAAKADMANAESELVAEKKFRENSLSIQKKQIERIRMKDASERHRRMQARRDMNMEFPNLIAREGTRGAKLETSKAQVEYQSLVTTEVDKIKCAVQCSHLWDIAGRFMAQKKSEENLQQQIVESEKKRRELKARLKELELERAELKFHQTPSAISSRKLEEELRKALEEEQARLAQVQGQVCKNQELLLHFENGLNNLLLRLCGIRLQGQEDPYLEAGDTFDILQFCETRLLHLTKAMEKLPSYNFSQEESNETFIHVRNFLEESTREEPQNLRATFEEDDDDVREVFNFADIDHSYVPNREDIKKQGLKLIEDKTKVAKKKQRGSSKK